MNAFPLSFTSLLLEERFEGTGPELELGENWCHRTQSALKVDISLIL